MRTDSVDTLPVDTPEPKKKERGLFFTIIVYGLAGFLFAMGIRLVVEPTLVVGQSMDPTLHNGQYMLNLKTAYLFSEPNYGDIVIVEDVENETGIHVIIKRVIGLPGDTIEIKDNELYRNGEKLMEPYIAEKMKDNPDATFVIEEGDVFVMGDNRNHSLDSRMIGSVNIKEQVRGKIFISLRPFDQSFKENADALPGV